MTLVLTMKSKCLRIDQKSEHPNKISSIYLTLTNPHELLALCVVLAVVGTEDGSYRLREASRVGCAVHAPGPTHAPGTSLLGTLS